MKEISVRRASLDDLECIAKNNEAMALETEGLHLDPSTVRSGVSQLLSDTGKGFYFLAEREGHVLGQLMITFEWSDWRNGDFWWIQSVYVDPESRREGVFDKLFSHVRKLAEKNEEICGLRLYVEKENHRAMDVYSALGMDEAHYKMYEIDFTKDVK